MYKEGVNVWCGVVWCGVVWCGVGWGGVVWCGVVWCGVVWCVRVRVSIGGVYVCVNCDILYLYNLGTDFLKYIVCPKCGTFDLSLTGKCRCIFFMGYTDNTVRIMWMIFLKTDI